MYYYGSVVSSFSKSKRDCLLIPKDLNNLGPGSNYTNNDLKILHVKSPSYSIRNKHKNIIFKAYFFWIILACLVSS